MPPQNRYQNTTGDESHQELIDRAVTELGMDESLATELSKVDAESSVGGRRLELGRTLLRAMLTHDNQIIWNSFNSLQRVESSLTGQDALIDSIREEVTRQYYNNLDTLVEQGVTELGINRPLAELISKIGDRSLGGSGRGERLLQAFFEHDNLSIGQLFRRIQEQDGDSLDYIAKQIPGSDKAPVSAKDLLVLIELEVERQKELNRTQNKDSSYLATAYPWQPIKLGFEMDADKLSSEDREKLHDFIKDDKCQVHYRGASSGLCREIAKIYTQRLADNYEWNIRGEGIDPYEIGYYTSLSNINEIDQEFLEKYSLFSGLPRLQRLNIFNGCAIRDGVCNVIIASPLWDCIRDRGKYLKSRCADIATEAGWTEDNGNWKINKASLNLENINFLEQNNIPQKTENGYTCFYVKSSTSDPQPTVSAQYFLRDGIEKEQDILKQRKYWVTNYNRMASVYRWNYEDGNYSIAVRDVHPKDRDLLKQAGAMTCNDAESPLHGQFIIRKNSPVYTQLENLRGQAAEQFDPLISEQDISKPRSGIVG